MTYIQFSNEDLIYLQSLIDVVNSNKYPESIRSNYKCFVTGATYQRDYTVKTNLLDGKLYLVNKITAEIYAGAEAKQC